MVAFAFSTYTSQPIVHHTFSVELHSISPSKADCYITLMSVLLHHPEDMVFLINSAFITASPFSLLLINSIQQQPAGFDPWIWQWMFIFQKTMSEVATTQICRCRNKLIMRMPEFLISTISRPRMRRNASYSAIKL